MHRPSLAPQQTARVIEEEKENIKEHLYNIYKGDIMKYATFGLAQWYKEQLLEGKINGINNEN